MDTPQTMRLRSYASHAGSVGAYAALMAAIILCGACSSNPQRDSRGERPVVGERDSSPTGSTEFAVLARVAKTASGQIGVPYHYGGDTPRGFDCSGLVFYSYGESGVRVPRTSEEQLHAVRALPLDKAVPGDLLFFRTQEKGLHVGIYLGDQRFVHAPSTGKRVVVNELDQEYYRRHLVKIGRMAAFE